MRRLIRAEAVGKEVVFLRSGFRHLVAVGLVGDREVDLYVSRSAVKGPTKRPAMMVPGNPGLTQLKSNSSPGLPSESVTERDAPMAPLAKTFMPCGTLMRDLRREAVGHETGGGEPAPGIQQVADGFLNRRELQAFDGTVFLAGDDPLVVEGPAGALARCESFGRGYPDGAVSEALAGEHFCRLHR